MKNFILVFAAIAVVLCVALAPARAELITIVISGQVTSISDQYNHFGGQISVGDTITGTYTYDSAILDSEPSIESGLYYNTNNLCGISLYVGGFNFKTDPTKVDFLVSVGNWTSGTDNYGLLSYHNLPLSDGTLVQHISWQLDDPTGTALSSDALPLTAPDLSRWQSWFGLSIGTDRTFGISATITSAVLVPEPATILLFGLGLLLIKRIH